MFHSTEIPQELFFCNAEISIVSAAHWQSGAHSVETHHLWVLLLLQERRFWLQQPWDQLTFGPGPFCQRSAVRVVPSLLWCKRNREKKAGICLRTWGVASRQLQLQTASLSPVPALILVPAFSRHGVYKHFFVSCSVNTVQRFWVSCCVWIHSLARSASFPIAQRIYSGGVRATHLPWRCVVRTEGFWAAFQFLAKLFLKEHFLFCFLKHTAAFKVMLILHCCFFFFPLPDTLLNYLTV